MKANENEVKVNAALQKHEGKCFIVSFYKINLFINTDDYINRFTLVNFCELLYLALKHATP